MDLNENLIIEASIGENFFAPKCIDRDKNFDIRNSHAIANVKCNFKCEFCKNGLSKEVNPQYMTLKEFDKAIERIIIKGKMFKFTGGEPCLNPHIEIMMKIIKKRGGIIFLDTNGSRGSKVNELLDKNLVDVLGISLKGLNEVEAIKTSGINNSKLCWVNPLNLIKTASKKNNVRVIVTYVVYDDFNYEKLCKFADLLEHLGNGIYLKINNLCGEKHRNKTIKAIDKIKLEDIINRFVDNNKDWKGKIILINSSEGVTEYSKIIFK